MGFNEIAFLYNFTFTADWDGIFEENRELLKSFIGTKSREELRICDFRNNVEMKGTFRKMNID